MTGVTEPTLLPEQAALIAALALAETDPTPRNKALVRQERDRVYIAAVERIEIERGIRPRRRDG